MDNVEFVMKRVAKGIFCLFLVAVTGCGGAETTGDASGTGGSSGTGGGAPTGGNNGSGNPADKFAGTWQASDWMVVGTCEAYTNAPPLELVAETDGTVSITADGCTLSLSVNGNVAELLAPVTCGPGTNESFRIELTSDDKAKLTSSGSINAGELSCVGDTAATLTRISTEAQP